MHVERLILFTLFARSLHAISSAYVAFFSSSLAVRLFSSFARCHSLRALSLFPLHSLSFLHILLTRSRSLTSLIVFDSCDLQILTLSYFLHNGSLSILRNAARPENNIRDLRVAYGLGCGTYEESPLLVNSGVFVNTALLLWSCSSPYGSVLRTVVARIACRFPHCAASSLSFHATGTLARVLTKTHLTRCRSAISTVVLHSRCAVRSATLQ